MIIVALFALGLCFGSFVNALVWRIHQQSLPKKKRAAPDKDLSISKGRSMCPHCKHILAWYDLLPVISWVILRGKCRNCKMSISWQYPLVELVTAVLFVASFMYWPADLSSFSNQQLLFGLWLTAIVAFMTLIVYDIRWMLLPNKIVFPLIGIGVLSAFVRSMASSEPFQTVLMALGGLAVAGGIFYLLFQISDGAWIGGGDVKLGFAIGLLLGSPILAFLMLFTASLLGLVAAAPGVLLRKSKLNSKLPFGPFLISATIIVILFGQQIIDWYADQYLFL